MAPRNDTADAPESSRSGIGALGRALEKRLSLVGPRRVLRRAGAQHVDPMTPDVAVVASALALNLLGLALPLAVLQVYDRITQNHAIETLTALALGLIVVAILEFALRLLQTFFLIVEARRRGFRRSVVALEKTLSSPSADGSVSDRVERFAALDQVSDYLSSDPGRAFIDLPFSLVFLTAIALIGGPLVIGPILVFLIFVVVLSGLVRQTRRLADKREEAGRRQAEFLGEIFSGALTVKGLGAERLMLRRFERLLQGGAKLFQSSVQTASEAQLASQAFAALNSVVAVCAGAVLVIRGDLTVGGLAACTLLSARAIQPLLRAAAAMNELQRATVAAEAAAPLFHGDETAAETISGPRDVDAALLNAPARLEVASVTFDWADERVLDEASFRLAQGALTLVIGAPGAPRAGLMRLLAGLDPASEGEVLLDGAPITEMRRPTRGVALVGPSARLFRGTILENLTLFGAGGDVTDALWAADLLQLNEIIGDLPLGYDTLVGRGVSDPLSKAAARRVALARAIATRPRALLLDEPFAHLDSASEVAVSRAMRALVGETTMAAATDRPQLLPFAARMLELRDGWVLEADAGAQRAAS